MAGVCGMSEQWLDETASVDDLKRMLKEQGIPLPVTICVGSTTSSKALQEKRGFLRMPGKKVPIESVGSQHGMQKTRE